MLIEREALLARLATAQRDGGRLVFVGGEAGVGKTALVRGFAADTDARVLEGACEHLVTPAPLPCCASSRRAPAARQSRPRPSSGRSSEAGSVPRAID